MSEKNSLQEYCQKHKLAMPEYKSWSTGPAHRKDWFANVTIKIGGEDVIYDTLVPTISKTCAEKQAAALMLDHIKTINKKNKSPTRLAKLKGNRKLTLTLTHTPTTVVTSEDSIITTSEADDDIIEVSPTDYSDDGPIEDIMDDVVPAFQKIGSFANIYLIDLENKPCFKDLNKFKNDSVYIGFLNSIHHSVDKYNMWHKCRTDDIAQEVIDSNNNKLLYLVEGGTADLVDHFMTAMLYPIVECINNYNLMCNVHIISGDHAGWCTRACLEKILKWKKITSIEITNTTRIG